MNDVCARIFAAVNWSQGDYVATIGNDTILIRELDVLGLDALGGTDTLVATTAIKTLNMATANAEIFRGSNTVLVDNDDIVTAVGSLVAVKLYGFLGNDALTGSSFDDVLDGGVGSDTLDGGDGNDAITGGAGIDFLYGGIGDDLLYFDADDLMFGAVDGGAGIDRAFLQGTVGVTIADLDALGIENISLSSGADSVTVLATSTLAHTLQDGGGNDSLYGGGGADNIDGGEGLDSIEGGDGADRLVGGAGSDTISGGGNNDVIIGGTGADYLYGGTGDDSITFDIDDLLMGVIDGGIGSDSATLSLTSSGVTIANMAALGIETLTLSNGADAVTIVTGDLTARRILAGGGSDTLVGGDGKDNLDGGADADDIAGGGNDDILTGSAGNDTISGGAGNDRIDGGTQNDYLDGGIDNDFIVGSTGFDTLFGGLGSDTLDGGADGDVLYGGDGNDNLIGGAGADTLDGGADNDSLQIDADDIIAGSINGGTGSDTARVIPGTVGVTITDLAALSIERLLLAEGDDNVTTNSTLGNGVTVDGGAGNDTLIGGSGNDFLDGSMGLDSLVGGNGDDILRDVQGTTDTLIGGEGNDILYIDQFDLAGGIIAGGAGIDRAVAVTAVTGFMLASHGVELFSGSAGDDSADATGVATSVTLTGGAGNDTLTGSSWADGIDAGAGNDSLVGGDGNDTLYGGDGVDTLVGGQGNDLLEGASAFASSDTLIGGAGNDTLNGGGGIDRAVFSNNFADYDFLKITTGNPLTSGDQATHARNTGVVNDGVDLVATDTEIMVFADLTLDTTVNNASVAVNDTVSVNEDNSVSGNVLSNDFDYDVIIGKQLASALTVSLVTGPASGTLTLNASGSYTYTPTANFSGSDSFTYKINDGFGDSNVATVNITVAAINDAPVLTGLGATTSYLSVPVVIDSTVTISDVDNSTLNGATVSISNFSAGDLLLFTNQSGISGNYNSGTGVLTLTGPATLAAYETALESISFSTASAITTARTINFSVSDGSATSNIGTGTVTITDPNDNDTLGAIGNQNLAAAAVPLYGGAGNDTLTGTGALDSLYGGSGNDTLSGGNQSDLLYGGSGNDVLNCDNQGDTLFGGLGVDTLAGGGQNDRFSFISTFDSVFATPDVITDFTTTGSDIIDLSAIDANVASIGDNLFLWAGQSNLVSANSVSWYQSGGNTFVQGDVNGDATADFLIQLTGLKSLAQADFAL